MTSYWRTYVPSRSMPWNIERARHLHRRAGFGVTWAELQRDLHDGPETSLTRMLSGQSRAHGQREDFDSMSHVLGEAAVRSEDETRLRAWWLFRILFTPDPLKEKLTLMWHNHFATSNLKVNSLHAMHQQNELFREHARGLFGSLLKGILRDPAMLVWLDANSNRQGHPNENMARELMELFTLGVGNYSEEDVKQAARALTGWSVKANEVRFRSEHHDSDSKTILGKTDRFEGDSLAELLLGHKATSRRLAWRLCDLLMGERVVTSEALEELASGLSERHLDIGWGVETILRSEPFFAEPNIGSRVSSPVEFIISSVRSLELYDKPPGTPILADWCSRLGQELFRPPNVGGWNGGRSWLSSRTVVGRANFAAALVAGELHSPVQPLDLESLITRHCKEGSSSARSIPSLLGTLLTGGASLGALVPKQKKPEMMVVELLRSPQAYLT